MGFLRKADIVCQRTSDHGGARGPRSDDRDRMQRSCDLGSFGDL